METELEVDIIAYSSFDDQTNLDPLRKTKVRINFYGFATHLPCRRINLSLSRNKLCSKRLSTLIDSRLHDSTLSLRIADKIVAEAIQYVEFQEPYTVYVDVVSTQNVEEEPTIPVSEEEEDEEIEIEDEIEEEEEEEEEECAICLEDLYNNDETFDLPCCSHRFHHRCVAEWLQKHHSCPICRGIMIDDDKVTDETKV